MGEIRLRWTFQRVFARHYNESVDLAGEHGVSTQPSFLTPCGAVCTHLYCAGALLERYGRKGEPIRARLADPTGVFELYIDRTNTIAAETLESFELPCFASVTGEVMNGGQWGIGRCAIRVGGVREIDRQVRDTWVLRTADLTLKRLERIREEIISQRHDALTESLVALHHIDIPRLMSMASLVKEALSVVDTGQTAKAGEWNPAAVILGIIREDGGKAGITMEEVARKAARHGMSSSEVEKVVLSLLQEDECYQPSRGVLKPL